MSLVFLNIATKYITEFANLGNHLSNNKYIDLYTNKKHILWKVIMDDIIARKSVYEKVTDGTPNPIATNSRVWLF